MGRSFNGTKKGTMTIDFIFRWYDFWIGLFWDSKKRYLYVFYFPMCGIVLKFQPSKRRTEKCTASVLAKLREKYNAKLRDCYKQAEKMSILEEVYNDMRIRLIKEFIYDIDKIINLLP